MQHEPNPDEESWPENNDCRPPAVVQPNWLTHARSVALRHWNPKELAAPTVDPDFEQLTAVERSAEVFRHTVMSFEYWLAPKGGLREWIRFNCRIAAIIGVPALLVVGLISALVHLAKSLTRRGQQYRQQQPYYQ